jgi:hypothetical protein
VGIHEHHHNDDVDFLSKAQVTPGTVYIEIKQTQKAKLLEGKQAHL